MAIQALLLVMHGQLNFRLKRNPPEFEFGPEGEVINALRKTCSQFTMHFHRSTNKRIRLRIFFLFDPSTRSVQICEICG